MRGSHRRDLQDIFARFNCSEHARKDHEASVVRKHIQEIVESVEEWLGIEDVEIEGEERQHLDGCLLRPACV